MGNRPISYQDVALQIFYASIFYPFANFRQLANNNTYAFLFYPAIRKQQQ